MATARERAEAAIRSCPEWYHSIELAPGVTTPGRSPAQYWASQLQDMRLPDLQGLSVLDIGAYDGYFSFAAERLGAARVTALDHYVWMTDMVKYMREWREARRTGVDIPPPHESRHWKPTELPGRRPFDAAREVLYSRVESYVGDFMTMDLAGLGQFDVVLFLGVLYHLEDPLRAMRRVASLTAAEGLAVIETHAVEYPGQEEMTFCEFYPGQEMNHDSTNWWCPNARALGGLCRAAGFREVTVLTKPPRSPSPPRPDERRSPLYYRAIAHARL